MPVLAGDATGGAGEHQVGAVGELARFVEHGQGPVRERHPVLAAGLHALTGNRPDGGVACRSPTSGRRGPRPSGRR